MSDKTREAAVIAASRMSNLLYNWSQQGWVPEEEAQMMKAAVAQFDSVKAALSLSPDSVPGEAEAIHPAVMTFARAMQHKLDVNRHKDGKGWTRNPDGSRNGWAGCSVKFLLEKLDEEVEELKRELWQHDDKHVCLTAVRNEAADIGNIAMMLADVSGALPHPPKPVPGEAEAVAWMHEDPKRADVIGGAVKNLLRDAALNDTSSGHLHRPLDKGERYTIPLYLHPPKPALPQGKINTLSNSLPPLPGQGIPAEVSRAAASLPQVLCEDCPPEEYPTDKTRCDPCPRKALPQDQPTELELHRMDYKAVRDAGWESPGELLSAYNTLMNSPPQGLEEFIDKEQTSHSDGCRCCNNEFCSNRVWYYVIPVKDLRTWMAGKALVPVEPTEAMTKAAQQETHDSPCRIRNTYTAMIEAAQGASE